MVRYFSTISLHSSPHVDNDVHSEGVRMMGRVVSLMCTMISTQLSSSSVAAAVVEPYSLLFMVAAAVVGVGIFAVCECIECGER